MDDFPAAEARALLARAVRRSVRVPGGEIALLDFGGDGPPVLLHHANGFCKGVLALVAERLAPRFRALAMDARGHGDSAHPEAPGSYAWARFAEDFAGVAEVVAEECRIARLPLAVGPLLRRHLAARRGEAPAGSLRAHRAGRSRRAAPPRGAAARAPGARPSR